MILKDVKYEIGEVVYLKTDSEQRERIVFCHRVYKNDILYEVACGTMNSCHYEFELCTEKDVLKTVVD